MQQSSLILKKGTGENLVGLFKQLNEIRAIQVPQCISFVNTQMSPANYIFTQSTKLISSQKEESSNDNTRRLKQFRYKFLGNYRFLLHKDTFHDHYIQFSTHIMSKPHKQKRKTQLIKQLICINLKIQATTFTINKTDDLESQNQIYEIFVLAV